MNTTAIEPAVNSALDLQAPGTLECNFWREGTTLECRGDGFLWDADDDGFDPDEQDHPCPQCNTLAYLMAAKEEAETCSEWRINSLCGTGESLWLNAVRIAEKANTEAARSALIGIGVVNTLVVDPQAEDGCRVQVYIYN